jgi:hypothetical protein
VHHAARLPGLGDIRIANREGEVREAVRFYHRNGCRVWLNVEAKPCRRWKTACAKCTMRARYNVTIRYCASNPHESAVCRRLRLIGVQVRCGKDAA